MDFRLALYFATALYFLFENYVTLEHNALAVLAESSLFMVPAS